MKKRFTAAILWGGKSSRMGQEKGFLPLPHGGLVIERVIDVLYPLFDEILLVSHHTQYRNPNVSMMISDERPDQGPMEGLRVALRQALNTHVFITGCDTPFLRPSLIRAILARADEGDCIIPEVGGRPQPLPALYSKAVLPRVEALMREGRLKMSEICDHSRAVRLPEAYIVKHDPGLKSFINLNTPDDYRKTLQMDMETASYE